MTEIKDPFPPKDTIEEELDAIAKKIPAIPSDFSELRQVLALLPSPIPSETPSSGVGDPGLFSVGAATPNQSSSSLIGGGIGTTPGTTLNTGLSGAVSIYGDGSDGVGDITVNSSLARDMYFTDLTVRAGVRLNTNGWKIYCSGLLTNLGTISNNGGDCTNSDGVGTYRGVGAAQNGVGGGGNGAYNSGSAQGTAPTGSLGGAGGGAGGFWYATGGYFFVGGVGAVPTVPTGVQGATYRDWDRPWRGILLDGALLMGGAGGSSGPSTGYGSPVAGGGGGGGGVVSIIAKIVANAGGVIEANGGKGGNTYTYPSGITAGGGGGGGGGVVLLTTTLAVSDGTVQALGGARGLGANPGTVGMAGAAGTVIRIIQA